MQQYILSRGCSAFLGEEAFELFKSMGVYPIVLREDPGTEEDEDENNKPITITCENNKFTFDKLNISETIMEFSKFNTTDIDKISSIFDEKITFDVIDITFLSIISIFLILDVLVIAYTYTLDPDKSIEINFQKKKNNMIKDKEQKAALRALLKK